MCRVGWLIDNQLFETRLKSFLILNVFFVLSYVMLKYGAVF